MSNKVLMYTDGACRGNPGPGGWGVWMQYREHIKELCGGEADTTNNRMELMAAIQGLEALTRPCQVDLYTDSQYVRKGISEWLENWKARGWRTAAKKPVKNADLWQRLDAATQQHTIEWHWVKGHSGDVHNERADALANQGLEQYLATS